VASPFDEVVMVLSFAPGAWTPLHTHGGPGLVTVTEGTITLRANGSERTVRTGESWSDGPEVVHQAGNTTSAPAMTVVDLLIPKGAAVTTPVAGAPKPPVNAEVKYQAKLADPAVQPPFNLVRAVLDFAPGTWTPLHKHGGPALITVLEGQVTVRQNGAETTYSAGQSWIEAPGKVHQAGNRASQRALVASNYLVPDGTQATTVVARS
jgi:quercetin dioxygenase-like cupin family protein